MQAEAGIGAAGNRQVVSHRNDSGFLGRRQSVQQVKDHLARLAVQVTRWIISQNQAGFVSQGTGNRYALLFLEILYSLHAFLT